MVVLGPSDVVVVVVVPLPRTMEERGVTPILDTYRTVSSTTGGWSRWIILMCFIYIILSTTVSHFWTLRMPFFTRSPFFVYISIFVSTLCRGTLCGCGGCCDCDVCTVVCAACMYVERVRGCDG